MLETRWTLRGMDFAGLTWPGTGPLTLLLHGFLDHAGAWEGVAAGLPGPLVALDHRGHGRSAHNPRGASYLFADYVADVDALVDLLSPNDPVRLVGHSMGGTIASLYAGARPSRVASLVSIDGLGIPDGVDSPMMAGGDPVSERMVKFLDGAKRLPERRAMPSVEAAAERLASTNTMSGPAWARRLAERGTVPVEGGVTWSFDPAHKTRSPVPYRHGHHVPLLRRITCPVLALHPSAGTFADDDIAVLEAAIPRFERATVPGTGHAMHQEAPALIAQAICAFWANNPSS